MSAQAGWLERLLDWAVGITRDDRLRHARADEAALLVPVPCRPADDWAHHARRDREREIELRALMSTWM
jgi:hypothetical protein